MAWADPRQDAILVLSRTFSSNPLAWWLARVQLLGFTLVAAVPIASAIALTLPAYYGLRGDRRGDLANWWTEQWWVAASLLAVSWFVWYRSVLGDRRRSAPCGWFSTDRVLLRRTPATPPATLDLAYAELGHIELQPPAEVHLRVGQRDTPGTVDVAIPLLRYTAEDEFDHLQAFLAEHAPEHPVSIGEGGTLSWSRRFALAELFPGAAEVDRARIGIATVLAPRVDLVAGAGTFGFSLRDGLLRDASGQWLLEFRVTQVLCTNGMVLAEQRSDAPGGFDLRFGSGEVLALTPGDELRLAGARVGEARFGADAVDLRFDRNVPEVLALVTAIAAMRAAYAVRNL